MKSAPQFDRYRRIWLLFLLCSGSCLPASAAERASFDYLIDADGRLGIADVVDSNRWTRGKQATFGFRSGAVWLKTDVPPTAEVMIIDNGWLDDIEVFFVADDRDMVRYHTGNHHPFASRAIGSPPFAFPVPKDSERLYVRSIGHSAQYLPISFTTHAQFDSAATSRALLQGCYYGIIIAMILYYAVLFGGMRDPVYLYYVLYAVSLMLMMLSRDGLGFQHLWGNSPTMQRIAIDPMTTLTIAFATLFAMAFLRLRRALPLMHRVLQIFVAIVLVNGIAGALFEHYVFPMINALLVVAGTLLLMCTAAVRLSQGFRPAAIYLFATGSLLVGSSLFVSMLLGWIDDGPVARLGVQLGSTAELILLAFALSQRMNEEHRKRMWMQHRSLELTREVRALKTGTQMAEEHRQLQRSLQQAQKLRTIGEMTGGFAHDFNNILASVLGFAELAKERVAKLGDHRLADFVDEIEHAGKRGSDLVKQLLIYSRGGNAAPHQFDLSDTITETVRFLRGTLPATVRIETDLPERPQLAFADPAHIQQMLVNLALNASEAMSERGNIVISLRRRATNDSTCASCAARFSGEHLVVAVADRGRGVTNAQDLFTPFYTTKPVGRGSGLGLSVVHGIAHEYGAHITVSPRAQGGTRFCVHLPLRDARVLPAQNAGNRILVIDDDRALARYLETMLVRHGFVVAVAHTSSEALERIMANPNEFDLVITDQLMPQVTGLELARDIRDVRPDLPVILCSGNPDAIDRAAMAHTAIKAVFAKPIESELLLAKVRGVLSEPTL
jgi:signal transduction histidine kinase/CheY-like chemotaxis protein